MNEKKIKKLEENLADKIDYQKVQDIPEFPLDSFSDVIDMVSSNKYNLSVDYTVANRLAQGIYGGLYSTLFLLAASTSFIIVVLSIVFAIIFKNYWLLFGIPIGFMGQFTSNPYNILRSFFNFVTVLLTGLLIFFFAKGVQTGILLTSFYVGSFFIYKLIYRINWNKLAKVAMSSEKIFIYLYQGGVLSLQEAYTQKIFRFKPAFSEEETKTEE